MRRFEILLALSALILLTGCGDRVRTTSQLVELRVTDLQSNEPMSDCLISLRYGKLLQVAKSDTSGYAPVRIENTIIDTTIGPWPPKQRDLTGQSVLVTAKKDQMILEKDLKLENGSMVEDNKMKIEVLRIYKPHYIPTE